MDYVKKAEELFCSGYNCAQATFCAFADKMNLDYDMALKMSSSFGGGMGRMREVCGACSGIFMVAGILYGYSDPKDSAAKSAHYQLIRDLAEKFKTENGSIICRELLGTAAEIGGIPAARTPKYYKTRPCIDCVKSAAKIMSEYIQTDK